MRSDIYSLFQFSIVEWMLLGALSFIFILELIYYISLYRKPYTYARNKPKKIIPDDQLPHLSVVITSKNDSENLEKNLPYILEQKYPHFDVVVVNDGSTDDTDIVLNRLQQLYPHLYHTYVPRESENVNGKKRALTIGIKAAKSECLVFTEAHCKPSSDQWLKSYGEEYFEGKEIVIGISKPCVNKTVPMRNFMLYEDLIRTVQYIAMALKQKPFMANGENMGYRKEHFFSNKGFSSVLHIEGGEDNVFINRTAKGKKTGVIVSREGITASNIIDTYATWRVLSGNYTYTKQFYKGFRSLVFDWEILLTWFFYISFILTMVVGITSMQYALITIAVLLFLGRFFTLLHIINRAAKWIGTQKFHINLLIFDIIHSIKNAPFTFSNKK